MSLMMNSYAVALLLLVSGFGVFACGSTDAPASSASGGAAGTTDSGGRAGSAAGAGIAGFGGSNAIAGATSAGAPSVAGSSGSGGASGSAGTTPTGPVIRCTGNGCPYGPCDDNGTTTCHGVYPATAPALCKADGDYCLVTGTTFNSHIWVVHCLSGNASSGSCVNGCSYGLGTANCSGAP